MQITIIGAGNMARGIATRTLVGGHTVRIIDRVPDKAARLAAGLQENAAAADVQAAGATGIGGAGIVVLAQPYSPARNRHLAADAGPGARSLASVMRFFAAKWLSTQAAAHSVVCGCWHKSTRFP